MALSETLSEAYRATHYVLRAPPACVLRVDVPSQALAALLQRHGVRTGAFVTAFNPLSEPLAAQENARRDAALVASLVAAGHAHLPMDAVDPSGAWPPEHGHLVLGITLAAAQALGRAFAQNAILFAAADGVPRLIVLV